MSAEELLDWVLRHKGLVVVALIYGVQQLFRWAQKQGAQQRSAPRKQQPPPLKPRVLPAPPPASGGRVSPSAAPLRNSAAAVLQTRVSAALAQAAALARGLSREPLNRRFLPVLEEYVPARASALRAELGQAQSFNPAQAARRVLELELVVQEVDALIRQRRDKTLGPALGDIDALADACYGPVIQYAHAEGLPLTTAEPAAHLSEVDLSIWTGFAPTSLAPLFLPPDFLSRLVLWPALAHEVGHDFLISVENLSAKLRAEMGLMPEAAALRPLRPNEQGQTVLSAARLVSAWFDELFCDTFGVMMCGPAYVRTMQEVFAPVNGPVDALLVGSPKAHAPLFEHPPAHVRVALGCYMLERMGHSAEARALLAQWHAKTGLPEQLELFVPVSPPAEALGAPAQMVGVAAQPFLGAVFELAEKLYAGPLQALGGVGLVDISGLDFGPHAQAEALRVKGELLRGGTPKVTDPRLALAGAVLARFENPNAEPMLIAKVRAMVRAKGTLEARQEAVVARVGTEVAPPPPHFEIVAALMLREALSRHRSARSRL